MKKNEEKKWAKKLAKNWNLLIALKKFEKKGPKKLIKKHKKMAKKSKKNGKKYGKKSPKKLKKAVGGAHLHWCAKTLCGEIREVWCHSKRTREQ